MPFAINRHNLDNSGAPIDDDLRIHYETSGSQGDAKGALVFAHGFTLDYRLWQEQLEYFSREYFVVSFDSRGHGLSDAPVTGYSRDHRQTDLQAVVDELGLEKFHLIGLSMGGATSIGFAIDQPECLESLTLVSSGVTAYNPTRHQDALTKLAREKGVEAARERWINSTLRYYTDKPGGARELLETMMREHSAAPWQDPNRGNYQHRKDLELLRDMEVRTLILVGARDLNFVPMGERLNESIPDSRMEVIPDVGHIINLEVPAQFNERLKNWFENGV
jgi:3-oxoadipate enol-lactonase